MQAVAVMLAGARAKDLQFLELVLYLLDCALPLPQYFHPEMDQGSKQQPLSLPASEKRIECLCSSSLFNYLRVLKSKNKKS